jgi:hypothetical protein
MKEGRVQVTPYGLDISMLCFSVHRRRHKPPYMEPDLNEVRVLSKGLGNLQGQLGCFLDLGLSRLTTSRGSTNCA